MRKSKSDAFTRRHPRYRVRKEGKIISAELRCGIDVIIRDMSVGGARMEIQPAVDIPDIFDLVVTSEYLYYPALVKWRSGHMIGIEFAGEPYRPSMLIGKRFNS